MSRKAKVAHLVTASIWSLHVTSGSNEVFCTNYPRTFRHLLKQSKAKLSTENDTRLRWKGEGLASFSPDMAYMSYMS